MSWKPEVVADGTGKWCPNGLAFALYQVLAANVAWNPPPNTDYYKQRLAKIQRLLSMLPSGSGWDEGTKLEGNSTGEKLILYGSFHHMNEQGSYDGWTDHTIFVKPSLIHGFELRITGPDRNDIKDLLHQMFDASLRQLVDEWGG